MASGYPIPTQQESEDLLVAIFRYLFQGSNVGARRSYHRRRMQVLAAALTELHAHIASVQDDVMPDSATGTMAERWGKLVGTAKKSATGARKSDALRVVGPVGTAITTGQTLTHLPSGTRYQIAETTVVPVAGEIDVDVAALDTGSATRLTKGEILDFDAPGALETKAELQKDLDEDGFDVEQESAFKRRYLDAFGQPTAGGNVADYVRWMEALAGVVSAYTYPNRAGRGTVDVLPLHTGTGTDRILSAGELDDVLAALRLLAPTQVSVAALRTLTAVPDAKPLEVTVVTNGDPQWNFDWTDSVPPVVSLWDPATNTLTFTAPRPNDMKAGDRICIHGVASAQDGKPLKIDSLVAGNAVKLESAPAVAPAATDVVYAGGPLTAVIRDALFAHMTGQIVYAGQDGPVPQDVADEQSTAFELQELAQPIGPANPGGKWGTWSGSIVRSTIERIATYARGTRDATCIVPAADYSATDYAFPDDAQIGLIVPSEILVRRAW